MNIMCFYMTLLSFEYHFILYISSSNIKGTINFTYKQTVDPDVKKFLRLVVLPQNWTHSPSIFKLPSSKVLSTNKIWLQELDTSDKSWLHWFPWMWEAEFSYLSSLVGMGLIILVRWWISYSLLCYRVYLKSLGNLLCYLEQVT